MSEKRRHRVEEIFQQALELSPDEREAFLWEQCTGDADLRAEVETLLSHYSAADEDFLDAPPLPLGGPGRKLTDPESIGPYRILQRLGMGGFGIVYVAEQTEPIRRRVALKIIKAGMDTDAVLARFEAERQALALMDHPHIARVLDAGATNEGRPYFVMELVKGDSLTSYCDQHRLTLRERLKLFVPICQAVQHAHQKGVIHRDLKPTNILVTIVDGRPVPKIIDFGIAKATATPLTARTLHTVRGEMIGTPAYMSPEQAELTGLDVDTTTDIYSLGAILYQLLCGSLPLDPKDHEDRGLFGFAEVLRNVDPLRPSEHLAQVTEQSLVIARQRDTDPWKLAGQLRGEPDWIVMRAIEKDRTRRYQTALDLAQDIEASLMDEPVSAGPPSASYRLRKFAHRHRRGIGFAAVILAGLLAAGAALTYALIESNRQRAQATLAQRQSEAYSDFLSQMLSAVSPDELGRDVTVKQVLDQAGPELSRQFAEQPLIEARLRTTMGAAYRELGEYASAEQHLLRSLELRGNLAGENDPQTLESKQELGVLWTDVGDFARAESSLTSVLRVRETTLGPGARRTLESVQALATLYVRLERNDELVTLLEEALPRAEALGEEDRLTRTLASSLGIGYLTLGRFDEAERIFLKNYEIDSRVFGPKHVETISTRNNLAALYRETGRLDEALPHYEASAQVAEEVYGPEHPEVLRFQGNLALAYSDLGRYDDAEPLLRHVVDQRDRVLGPENPSTIVSRINLALLYSRMERWRDCVDVATVTRGYAERSVGEGHLLTFTIEGILGFAYLGMDEVDRAETLLAGSVAKARAALPEGHWRTGRLLVWHGAALTRLGRFDAAEAVMLEGENALEASFGLEDDRVQDAVNHLVTLYERWQRPDLQAQWEARRRDPAS